MQIGRGSWSRPRIDRRVIAVRNQPCESDKRCARASPRGTISPWECRLRGTPPIPRWCCETRPPSGVVVHGAVRTWRVERYRMPQVPSGNVRRGCESAEVPAPIGIRLGTSPDPSCAASLGPARRGLGRAGILEPIGRWRHGRISATASSPPGVAPTSSRFVVRLANRLFAYAAATPRRLPLDGPRCLARNVTLESGVQPGRLSATHTHEPFKSGPFLG